jgi:cytochrome c556
MRGKLVVFTMCAFAVLALSVKANEKPTEAYQKAMKDNGAALQSLRATVKAIEGAGAYPDYTPLEKDLPTLKASFATTLAFWQAKKADDAIKLAQDAAKAVDNLETAMKDKNYRLLVSASTALGETCGSCHMAHRERLPDGSFEIK